jgi:hypothetical protein
MNSIGTALHLSQVVSIVQIRHVPDRQRGQGEHCCEGGAKLNLPPTWPST